MTRWLLLLLLVPALSAPALAAPKGSKGKKAAAPAAEAALPDGRELLFQEVNAAGTTKLDELKGLHLKGTFSMPAEGITADIDIWRAAPNLVRSRVEMAGVGTIEEGFDGTRAWAIDPIQGPRVRAGAEGEEAAFTATFNGDAHPERYVTVETLELGEFAGRAAYRVKVKPPGSLPLRFVWIDAETKQTLGAETTAATPMGDMPVVTTLSDFRDVGGMSMPFKMTQSMMNTEQTIVVTAVTLDPELPDFTPPAGVQELIAAEEAAAAKDEGPAAAEQPAGN
jgi:hypothetical protein